MDYDAANRATRAFKTALTRAKNKGDHAKVIAVAHDFAAYFAARDWPLPDNWSLFERAKEDAEFALRTGW